MEKKFEDQWQDAFKDAEAPPSDSVWSGLESELIAAENTRMKRSVVLYQRIAASLALLVVMLGALGMYYWKDLPETRLTQIKSPEGKGKAEGKNTPESKNAVTANAEPSGLSDGQEKITNRPAPIKGNEPVIASDSERSAGNAEESISVFHEMNTVSLTPKNQLSSSQLNSLVGQSNKSAIFQKIKFPASPGNFNSYQPGSSNSMFMEDQKSSPDVLPPAVALVESPIKIRKQTEQPFVLPGFETREDDKPGTVIRKSGKETLWASMGAAAGLYAPGSETHYAYTAPTANVIPASNYATQPATADAAQSSNKRASAGNSYSAGISLGGRISPRWILQGGVSYLTKSIDYSSSAVSLDAATNKAQAYVADYSANFDAVTSSSQYEINSKLEFVTIPLQAGYFIVDRKVGLLMNAGIASDFFVRNSLQDQTGQVSSYTKGPGADSPYRSISWSGLMSTELSYRIASQYRVSVVPGLRYSFNPELKSGSEHPYILDVGFRFKYILM
jgi:hypothetical protein